MVYWFVIETNFGDRVMQRHGVNGLLVLAMLMGGMAQGAGVGDGQWISNETKRLLEGCRVEGKGGVWIHTPDGVGHYRALWTRDFAYMVEYAGDLLDAQETKAEILYLLEGQRADGCIPDRVNAEGVSIYSPGGEKKPMADHALDNGPFLAQLVGAYVEQTGDLAFFKKVEPAVRKGLNHIRRGANGLVYNSPEQPECVYGFTDIVTKTGHLLFCSLLYYDACMRMERLCERANWGEPAEYKRRAGLIKKNIDALWNDKAGMFWAADIDCKQVDIWGSAYAVEVGLATKEQADRISGYFIENYSDIVQRGQVRHLAKGEHWDRTFGDHGRAPGTYQNGAFWATPLAWVAPVVGRRDAGLARQMVSDAIADFRKNGVYECINGDYNKVENFVVSTVSLYHLVKQGKWVAQDVKAGGVEAAFEQVLVDDGADLIFPSVIKAGDYFEEPLREWYMYTGPHRGAEVRLYVADDLKGPWVLHGKVLGEAEARAGHVSSPHAIWNEAEGCLFLYVHAPNDQTIFCRSTDGVNFEYGGVCVTNKMLSDVVGFESKSASYARVYPHEIKAYKNKYVMTVTASGKTEKDGTSQNAIVLCTSNDGIQWTARRTLMDDGNSGRTYKCLDGALAFVKGRTSLVYGKRARADEGKREGYEAVKLHVTVGDLELENWVDGGVFYEPRRGYPDEWCARGALFVEDGEQWWMVYEGGVKNGAKVGLLKVNNLHGND